MTAKSIEMYLIITKAVILRSLSNMGKEIPQYSLPKNDNDDNNNNFNCRHI